MNGNNKWRYYESCKTFAFFIVGKALDFVVIVVENFCENLQWWLQQTSVLWVSCHSWIGQNANQMSLSRANGINSLELVTIEQAQSGLLEARKIYFWWCSAEAELTGSYNLSILKLIIFIVAK